MIVVILMMTADNLSLNLVGALLILCKVKDIQTTRD